MDFLRISGYSSGAAVVSTVQQKLTDSLMTQLRMSIR